VNRVGWCVGSTLDQYAGDGGFESLPEFQPHRLWLYVVFFRLQGSTGVAPRVGVHCFLRSRFQLISHTVDTEIWQYLAVKNHKKKPRKKRPVGHMA
jgi:hypothetical protein